MSTSFYLLFALYAIVTRKVFFNIYKALSQKFRKPLSTQSIDIQHIHNLLIKSLGKNAKGPTTDVK